MMSGNNQACTKLMGAIAVLLIGLLLTGPVIAAEENTPHESAWNLMKLMHKLAQTKESRAFFIERKHLSMLNAPLESSGTLSYTAPDHLEKITLWPKPETLVLDRDKLLIRSGTAPQRMLSLHEFPAIWAFVESIRATLAGDLVALEHFYEVELEGNSAHWLLLLHPRNQNMKKLVTEIRISGSAAQLESIEIRETEGDYSVMRISKDDT